MNIGELKLNSKVQNTLTFVVLLAATATCCDAESASSLRRQHDHFMDRIPRGSSWQLPDMVGISSKN